MSGLNGILSNALSALSTNQAALRATSTNIANVNTPGYTRRLIEQQSAVAGSESAGVKLSDPRRAVDGFVTRELRVRAAEAERYKAQLEYQDRLQVTLGKPQDSFSMAGRLNAAISALGSLSIAPESQVDRRSAIDGLQSWGDEVGRVAQQVQDLRADADQRIAALTGTVNSLLNDVKNLNPQIVAVKSTGGDATGLEETRDQAVQKLSSLVDVQVSPQDDGSYHILTQAGVVLLDTALRQLRYTPQGVAAAGISFGQIAIDRVDPATGQAVPTTGTLDSQLRGGELKGLIDVRNVQLPELASELGEMASGVVDQINRVHNANVGGATSLTGRPVGALSTDANHFTGSATFAVLDANNNIVSSTTVNLATAGATLGAVISTVNTALGGAGTLALNNGVMSFTAASGSNSVAIAQDPTTPSSLGGHGFADHFGMNDLLVARVPASYDTGLASGDATGFSGGTVGLRLVGPGGDVAGTYSLNLATSGATVGATLATLNSGMSGYASFTLDANGAISTAVNGNYQGYTLEITNDTTERGGAGTTGTTFSRLFGLGEANRSNAAFDIAVRSDIATNPGLMSLQRLSLAGTPAIAPGDNRGALALAQIDQQTVSFGAAGDLPATAASLTGYTGQVLGAAATTAAAIDSQSKDSQSVRDAIEAKRNEVSAVNIDEELANMIAFQNAYNAAARLITTAQQLYDTLLGIVQ